MRIACNEFQYIWYFIICNTNEPSELVKRMDMICLRKCHTQIMIKYSFWKQGHTQILSFDARFGFRMKVHNFSDVGSYRCSSGNSYDMITLYVDRMWACFNSFFYAFLFIRAIQIRNSNYSIPHRHMKKYPLKHINLVKGTLHATFTTHLCTVKIG